MNIILILRKEHQEIESYLIRLEEIMDEEFLDVSSFNRNFYEMVDLLNSHERREESFFEKVKRKNPVLENDLSELNILHEAIKGHLKVIHDAIRSGNIAYIKLALDNDARMFISKVRNHFHKENEIFDKILFLHLIGGREFKRKIFVG